MLFGLVRGMCGVFIVHMCVFLLINNNCVSYYLKKKKKKKENVAWDNMPAPKKSQYQQ